MYVGIWCIYEEIWLKIMTMGEWNDLKMDGFINKIMTNQRPNTDRVAQGTKGTMLLLF